MKRRLACVWLADDQSVKWSAPGGGGDGGLERLAAVDWRGAKIAALMPPERVLLTAAQAPTASRKTAIAAAPFAIEEKLLEDLETAAVVVADKREASGLVVGRRLLARMDRRSNLATRQSRQHPPGAGFARLPRAALSRRRLGDRRLRRPPHGQAWARARFRRRSRARRRDAGAFLAAATAAHRALLSRFANPALAAADRGGRRGKRSRRRRDDCRYRCGRRFARIV